MSSADTVCKQFVPRSGLIRIQTVRRSEGIPKIMFPKSWFWNNRRQNYEKFPNMQRVIANKIKQLLFILSLSFIETNFLVGALEKPPFNIFKWLSKSYHLIAFSSCVLSEIKNSTTFDLKRIVKSWAPTRENRLTLLHVSNKGAG